MVPADAEPNNANAARGVAWASYGKSVLGTTGVGLFVTQLDPPVADSLHIQHHQTLSVLVRIFSSYAFFFFPIGQDLCQKLVLGVWCSGIADTWEK